MIEIILISLLIIGVLMIPAPKKMKRDKYSDEVISIVCNKFILVEKFNTGDNYDFKKTISV